MVGITPNNAINSVGLKTVCEPPRSGEFRDDSGKLTTSFLSKKAEKCVFGLKMGIEGLHRGIERLGCIVRHLMAPAIPAIWEMSVIYYLN